MKKILAAHKVTISLVAVILLIVLGSIFAVTKIFSAKQAAIPAEEVDLPFDPDGPYALVIPRRDGNAVVLNIKRVASYEAISYEMAYQSDGVDRGVTGNLNMGEKKDEYSQEILFGTCSKGDTFSTLHCVFDKNVENGTLTLRITKKDDPKHVYKMIITWHLQKPDVALGVVTSGDNHFTYKTAADRSELSIVGFSIVNELSGMPKLPADKQVVGKVYAFNVPTAKTFPKGDVSIELAESPNADAKIARYNEGKGSWDVLETKIKGSTISAPATSAGIFAVLSPTPSK